MLLKSRTRWSVVAGTVVLLTTAIVFAQNAPATKRQETRRQEATKQNPNRQDAKRQDATRQDANRKESKRPNVVTTKKVPGQVSRADSQIAACLVIDHKNEIALAQFASQRSQNAEVKDFAQKIAADHQELVNQLQPIASAGGYDLDRPAGASKSGKRRNQRSDADAKTSQRQDTAQRTDGARANHQDGIDFIAVKQEIAEKCLQSARQALEEKQADKFDKCFVQGQVMMHTAMVDALEVLKNHASGELTSIIDDGLKTSQAHLDEAKRLEKTLESAAQK
jgi:predicted outer membrane protein